MLDFLKSKRQSLSKIDLSKSILEANYIVIDTELTGLDEKKDSIISIGAIKMTGTKIYLDRTFYRLINPRAKFKPESVLVHGITPSDVLNKPGIDTIIKEFIEFCGNDIIIGYCVSIDLSFINREWKRLTGNNIENYTIDIFVLYEYLKKNLTSNKCFSITPTDTTLYEIARCLEIPTHGAHDALFDAYITAQLFQRFISQVINIGIKDLAHLLVISSPEKGGEIFKARGEITNF